MQRLKCWYKIPRKFLCAPMRLDTSMLDQDKCVWDILCLASYYFFLLRAQATPLKCLCLYFNK